MTKFDLVMNHDDQAGIVADKLKSDFSQSLAGAFGSPTPRIHTPLNDLPSRGFEIIDFASMLKVNLMPWQKFVLEHSHKIKANGKYATPLVCTVVSRQSGKSTMMLLRIYRVYIYLMSHCKLHQPTD